MKKRLILVALVAAALVLFFVFDLDHWLSFARLQQGQAQLESWVQSNPWLVSLGYFALYVLIATLSLPGATVMTLAGGALFGLWWGTLLVSFASSLGAALAFLVARFLFHDWVQHRFSDRLQTVNRGIEKEGAFYLFTLRLVPVFPFFLINLVMALTPIRAGTFYWVSQVGMLPATAVYVNAGTRLAQVQSPGDILSPGLIASFALIGLLPLLSKRVIAHLERRKIRPG
ncbi:TVP38/TMEM64 family protein [Gilvimarinus sp. F26214L]|uniref:TVP38/TMEM64 family protein n=1 Tax=Gilvimarinus sp. DZF01 TaxID=3461371 RepID=UPI0040452FA3